MQIIKGLSPDLILTAPSGSITTIPKWFWYGTRRLLPVKNTLLEGISILLHNHSMSEPDYDYLDAILSVRRTDDAPTTSLLRDLRYTLIKHQYETWIERNEAQPRGLHKPSYTHEVRHVQNG